MTLREFLDASYVALVERFQTIPNVGLEQALEMAGEWRAGAEPPTAGGSEEAPKLGRPDSDAVRRAQEERDLAEFDAMIEGTVARRV